MVGKFMKIQSTQNYQYTHTFGTYFSINMQEKILLAKQRNLFSKEQLANLAKIENDGFEALLDIAQKFVIHSSKRQKGTMRTHKQLILKDEFNKTPIADIDDIYRYIDKNKASFLMHKFTHLFDDSYELPQKIKIANETLLNNPH